MVGVADWCELGAGSLCEPSSHLMIKMPVPVTDNVTVLLAFEEKQS